MSTWNKTARFVAPRPRALAAQAYAGSLQVSPIRVELSAEQPAAVMKLHNRGAEPLTAQVRVFGWSQTLDEDRLEEVRGIVVSPPIISIPAGGDQTVRVMRTNREPPNGEETYRLLVDEIPDTQSDRDPGVRMQLRYSVPVFAGAPGGSRLPRIDFALDHVSTPGDAKTASPRLMLRAANADSAHAQLSQVRIEWPDGHTTEVASGLLGYALAHATRQWVVADPGSKAMTATVHAIVNGTPVSTRVMLDSKVVVSSAK
jgi:fimbrial chaperone protein